MNIKAFGARFTGRGEGPIGRLRSKEEVVNAQNSADIYPALSKRDPGRIIADLLCS
jgi:hypothetical protein